VRVPDEAGSGLAKITLSFSAWPEGNVATATTDLPVTAFTVVVSEQLRTTLQGHTGPVDSVAYSPDGKILASSTPQGVVKLWDSTSGKILNTLAGQTSSTNSLAFAPDGKVLAVGVSNQEGFRISGEIRLWDVGSAKLLRTLKRELGGGVGRLAFSPDGKVLAAEETVGGRGRGRIVEVVLWDVRAEQVRAKLKTSAAALAFSPDGKSLATASRQLKMWDVETGQETSSLSGSFNSFAYSPDGRYLAGVDNLGTIVLWDMSKSEIAGTAQLEERPRLYSVAFSPDGRSLAVATGDRNAKLIKPADVLLFDVSTLGRKLTLSGHRAAINSVAFSPDGRMLATGSEDQTVRIWDLQKGRSSE
jgi:WD40 repeat protein